MNNDVKATVAGLGGASGLGAFAFLPPPYNFIGAMVAVIAQVVLGYITNKKD